MSIINLKSLSSNEQLPLSEIILYKKPIFDKKTDQHTYHSCSGIIAFDEIWFDDETNLVHNINKPAIVGANLVWWFVQGILHKLDGPAVYENNTEQAPYYWAYKGFSFKVEEDWKKEKFLDAHPELEAFI